MMNRFKISGKSALTMLSLSLVAVFMSVSCERTADSSGLGGATVPLRFSSPLIVQAVESRIAISGNDFPNSSTKYPIGLWLMLEDDPAEPQTPRIPQIPGFDNLKAEYYVADGWNDWDYFPFGADENSESSLNILRKEPLDIYAYYPWVSGVTDVTSVPFVSGEDDWMTAVPVNLSAEDTEPESGVEARLSFRHLMTCIEVRISCKYEGSISLTSMTLTDTEGRLVPSGTFDCTEVDPEDAVTCDEATNSLTISPNRGVRAGNPTSAYFIMPPVTGFEENQMKLSFMFNNIQGETEFVLPSKMKVGDVEQTITEFKRGYKYIYSLLLDNTMDFIPIGVEQLWTVEEILMPI